MSDLLLLWWLVVKTIRGEQADAHRKLQRLARLVGVRR